METKPNAISETVKAVFISSVENCRYYFKSGKPAIFQKGKFMTNVESEVKELMEEIAAGHPHISVNKDEMFVDTKYVDPMEKIRAQIREELLAEARAISAGDQDFGQSDQILKLNAATTKDISGASSGSTSVNVDAATGAQSSTVQSNTASVITPPSALGGRVIVPGATKA